jgi:ribulose-5-phosphate 4-epimerase/fuculose-1-phosphate aldolase
MSSQLQTAIDELVIANRILAAEKVCDAFGHVSIRHPEDPQKFLLSRGRAPELIEASDIMQFTMEGAVAAGKGKPYLERFIHGAIYESRPDVQAVVHSHSYSVVPFSVIGERLRPIMHVCATIGADIPVWDPQHSFGDTDLLVSDMQQGRDLARALGARTSILMRGHGSTVAGATLREAVYAAVMLEINANLQLKAQAFGPVTFLTTGEIEKIRARQNRGRPGEGFDRAWQYWLRHAGFPTDE